MQSVESGYIIVFQGRTNFNHLLFIDNNEKIPGLHPMRLVTTILVTAVLDQDRRGKYALMRAYDNSTSLVGDYLQITLLSS